MLTHDRLMYFRSDKDKTPRETLTFSGNEQLKIERVPDLPCAVDILLTSSSFSLKKRSRVSLMAETPREMRVWASLILCYAGIALPSISGKENDSGLKSAAPEIRRTALSLLNDSQQNPLHILCQTNGANLLQAAFWILSNGTFALTAMADQFGLQPVHYALLTGQVDLVIMLVTSGGHFTAEHIKDEATAEKVNRRTKELEGRIDAAVLRHSKSDDRFLAPQVSLRGFSYLTVLFLNHWILDDK